MSFTNEKLKVYRQLRRDMVNAIKLETGCQVCGYNKCSGALEFHHRNEEEKSEAINVMVNGSRSIKAIMDEINKCDVLCANCHRELHINAGLV